MGEGIPWRAEYHFGSLQRPFQIHGQRGYGRIALFSGRPGRFQYDISQIPEEAAIGFLHHDGGRVEGTLAGRLNALRPVISSQRTMPSA